MTGPQVLSWAGGKACGHPCGDAWGAAVHDDSDVLLETQAPFWPHMWRSLWAPPLRGKNRESGRGPRDRPVQVGLAAQANPSVMEPGLEVRREADPCDPHSIFAVPTLQALGFSAEKVPVGLPSQGSQKAPINPNMEHGEIAYRESSRSRAKVGRWVQFGGSWRPD